MTVLQLLMGRVAQACVTLFAVTVVVFSATQFLPGDPARAALGARADPTAVEALRHEFGLDRSSFAQYASWIGGAARGDFGRSIPSGKPVWALIKFRAINTVILTLSVLTILVPLSFVLGVVAAVYKDRFWDHLISIPTIVAVAVPEFVIGTILIVVFAGWIRVLPPVSLIDNSYPVEAQAVLFILPVLTLLGATLAQVVRMVRAVTLEVLSAEYIYMVRLRGVGPLRVLFMHVFPNVVSPTIQTIAFNAAWLAGGVVVTEAVFQLPGIGSALAEAVIDRDIPTVLAVTLMITGAYVVINLIAEILIITLNPRLRRGQPSAAMR